MDSSYRLVYVDPEVRAHFVRAATRDEVRALHAAKVRTNQDPAGEGLGYWGIVFEPEEDAAP
ncbi:MAG: hypothetical protein JXA09_01695 [Anaerolineae bacterium]|nr:hypothetical protein [Anaerolineae bacterium]